MDKPETDAPETNWKYEGDTETRQPAKKTRTESKITWSASEYIDHEKDAKWYLGITLVAAAVVAVVFLVTGDLLAVVAIVLAFVVIAFYAKRKPQTKEYTIEENGLKIGDKAYEFSRFRSFSLVDEGGINSIWLRPLKRFVPPAVIYCSPEDEDKIIDRLSGFLPYEDHELDAIDRFSRRIRF